MVWINTQCDNRPAAQGAFGGAKCVCPKCNNRRAKQAETVSRFIQSKVLVDCTEYLSMLEGLISYCAIHDHNEGVLWCMNKLLEYWRAEI